MNRVNNLYEMTIRECHKKPLHPDDEPELKPGPIELLELLQLVVKDSSILNLLQG